MAGEKIFSNFRIVDIAGGTVKHHMVHHMVGNVFWNCYTMPANYALGMVRLLQLSKKWQSSEGWSVIFDKFCSGDEITGKDFDFAEDFKPEWLPPANQTNLFPKSKPDFPARVNWPKLS
jgi:hypothetical protein